MELLVVIFYPWGPESYGTSRFSLNAEKLPFSFQRALRGSTRGLLSQHTYIHTYIIMVQFQLVVPRWCLS